jgi:hypothetical protein
VLHQKFAGLVKVYLDPDSAENYLRFEIAMPPIPTLSAKQIGYELVAIWQSKDIQNDEYFTDTNGLELIIRKPQKGVDK